MAEFLPDSSLYFFIGVFSVLFSMMLGCFLYHKGKTYFTKPIIKIRRKKGMGGTFKRGSQRNKFLMKKSERADGGDEDGMKEGSEDKMRAEIDAKFNNPTCWSTIASGEPSMSFLNEELDTASVSDDVEQRSKYSKP